MFIMHYNRLIGEKILHLLGHKEVFVRNLSIVIIFVSCMEINPFHIHVSIQIYSILLHIVCYPEEESEMCSEINAAFKKDST